MTRKDLNLERLHKVHAYKMKGVHLRRAGNTELMIQNICSTVEVNLGDKEYNIGISCHSLHYWKSDLLPRIVSELRKRDLPYVVREGTKIFVENVKIYRHYKEDRPEPEFLYEDLT